MARSGHGPARKRIFRPEVGEETTLARYLGMSSPGDDCRPVAKGGETCTAFATELLGRRISSATLGTEQHEADPALAAELQLGAVVVAALRATHQYRCLDAQSLVVIRSVVRR